MILREATIKYKDYDPNTLSKGSHKRICCSCDICGKIRWQEFKSYRSLCINCSLQQNPSMLGKKHTKEAKQKISNSRKEYFKKNPNNILSDKEAPNWQGGKITKICEECNNEFTDFPSEQHRFCSTKCFGKWESKSQLGENNPHWNPDLTDEDRLSTRQYPEYREWRLNVFKRDNFTCQKCNQYGGNINAHHLEGYANNKELRISLDNGITLCKDCHKNFHYIYGYNCNKEQFIEFMEINK